MFGKIFLKYNWMAILLVSALSSSAFAQELTQSEEDSATNQDEQAVDALEQYEKKKAEFKTTSRKINDSYANLNINSRAERTAQMESIKELQILKTELQLEIFQTALAAAKVTGEINRGVVRDALQYAQASLEGNKFNIPVDPAVTLDVCETLLKQEIEVRNLLPLIIGASLANLDFENAKSKVNAAINGGFKVSDEMIEQIKSSEKKWLREQKLQGEESNLPSIRLQTTLGDIRIVLFEDAAPQGVRNFVNLIDEDFFNDLKFFTAKRGQNVRSGCPNNRGNGAAEHFITNEANLESARHHFKGSLSMMSVSDGQMCSSQFLIAQRPLPHLDGQFTVIGRITNGMDVVDKIVSAVVDAKSELDSKPAIEIIEVTFRRPDTTYVPEKIDKK